MTEVARLVRAAIVLTGAGWHCRSCDAHACDDPDWQPTGLDVALAAWLRGAAAGAMVLHGGGVHVDARAVAVADAILAEDDGSRNEPDRRPSTDLLLGAGMDWCDGLPVDEYIDQIRRED